MPGTTRDLTPFLPPPRPPASLARSGTAQGRPPSYFATKVRLAVPSSFFVHEFVPEPTSLSSPRVDRGFFFYSLDGRPLALFCLASRGAWKRGGFWAAGRGLDFTTGLKCNSTRILRAPPTPTPETQGSRRELEIWTRGGQLGSSRRVRHSGWLFGPPFLYSAKASFGATRASLRSETLVIRRPFPYSDLGFGGHSTLSDKRATSSSSLSTIRLHSPFPSTP